MSLNVMSADSHMDLIYLPPDTFTSRMASTWRDRAPRVVERDGRKVWVSGDAVLEADGERSPFISGDVAFMPPGTFHTVINESDTDFQFYSVWWDAEMTEKFAVRHASVG